MLAYGNIGDGAYCDDPEKERSEWLRHARRSEERENITGVVEMKMEGSALDSC